MTSLTINGRQNSRVAQLLLSNQLRFNLGRNLDEVLFFDPLPVSHEDQVVLRALLDMDAVDLDELIAGRRSKGRSGHL